MIGGLLADGVCGALSERHDLSIAADHLDHQIEQDQYQLTLRLEHYLHANNIWDTRICRRVPSSIGWCTTACIRF